MRAEEIKGLMEAYSKVHETPEVLNEEVVEEDIEVLDEMGRPGGNLPGAKSKAQIAAAAERRMQANVQRAQAPTLPTTRSRGDASKYQAVARDKAAGGDAAYRAGGGDAAARGGLTRQQIQQKGMAATKAAPAKPAAGSGSTPPAKPAAGSGSTPPVKPAAAAAAPKPAAGAPAKPAAAPAKPAPGTKAAGPESIKPKTPNPLMQKTFGYQTGNAPDQIAKASAGKPTPSGSALGSAADPKVRAALNLPSKPAASLSQAPAPKPAEAPKPQMSAKAQALKAGGPAGSARERMLNQDLDLFDLVKGHLLDEGYADSEEGAMVIMVNMSEEWRESIIMELTGGKGHPGYKAGSKDHGDLEDHPAVKKGGVLTPRHGDHLGDLDDEDDEEEDDLEAGLKDSARKRRENVRKPLRDKVKAARKKMTKEGYAVTIEDIVKLLDENREHDREMRKAAARERAEEKKERKEEGKKSAKAPGRLGKSAGSSYADYQEVSIKAHDKATKGKFIPGMVKNEEVELVDEASYSAKAARAGKDIGKPGKAFAKIAKEAGERYGSKERGEKVAGAVLAKLRKEGYQRDPEKGEENEKEENKKYEKVRGEKTPMPPRGDKRREEFEKWYAKQMGR